MADIAPFLNFISNTAKILSNAISEGKIVYVISHYDADGLSSAGIIGQALQRENAIFHIRILRQLEEQYIIELASLDKNNIFLFLDFGSGQVNLLEKHLNNRTIIILDHHEPLKHESEFLSFFQINPHIFGIDGSTEISSSGIAYLLAKQLNSNNLDLSAVAVVGALGDSQDKGKQNSLVGLNENIIVKDGIDADVLDVSKGFMIFGHETRPVHIALSYCIDPYIPGLSGNKDNVIRFLNKIGLELKDDEGNWKTLASLSFEEKKLLASELISYMSQKGMSSKEMKSIIGTLYTLKKENRGSPLRDAREFATLLNSCGRMDSPELGLLVAMGYREEIYSEALSVYSKYKHEISSALDWLYNNRDKVKQLEYIQAFHGKDKIRDTIIGTVASIALNSRMLKIEKPIIAFSYSDNDSIKVSARATTFLVAAGVNLAEALRNAVKKIDPNTIAGGHNIAAGARIPRGSEDKFLELVNEEIKMQLNRSKGVSN